MLPHILHGGFQEEVDVCLLRIGNIVEKTDGVEVDRGLDGQGHGLADRLVEATVASSPKLQGLVKEGLTKN